MRSAATPFAIWGIALLVGGHIGIDHLSQQVGLLAGDLGQHRLGQAHQLAQVRLASVGSCQSMSGLPTASGATASAVFLFLGRRSGGS